MILSIGTKQALSSIRQIVSSNVTSHHLKRTVLNDNFCNIFRGSNLGSLRSSSTTTISSKKLPKRRRRKQIENYNQQQHQQQHQDKNPIPKWHAVVSVLIAPAMFAAWGVSDWFFGNKIKGYNEALRKKLIATHQCHHHHDDQDNDDNDDDDYLTVLETKPILFHCVIRKNTGFTHCLSGVQLGDVVEVLEERVGPDRSYNLCRLPAKSSTESKSLSTDTYGWFPIRWLQKFEHYEAMVQEQDRNISLERNKLKEISTR